MSWAAAIGSLLLVVPMGAAPVRAADEFLVLNFLGVQSFPSPIISANGVVVFDSSGRGRWDAVNGPLSYLTIAQQTAPSWTSSRVRSVSADGNVAVGHVSTMSGTHAAVWTGINSFRDIHDSQWTRTDADAVSSDGTTVIGTGDLQGAGFGFYWTDALGLQLLPTFASSSGNSQARYAVSGVSSDGRYVAGYWSASGAGRAGFWDLTGSSFDLPLLATHTTSAAYQLSADGSTIAGQSWSDVFDKHAYVWKAGSGSGTTTEIVVPGATNPAPRLINSDGSVIVGSTSDSMFFWRNGVVSEVDPLASHTNVVANGMSDDSTIVVGYMVRTGGQTAFRWSEERDLQTMAEALAGRVDLQGWTLDQATSISADGSIIVGRGTDPNNVSGAWFARCDPVTCGVLVSEDSLTQSFAGMGGMTSTASTYLSTEAQVQSQIAAGAPGAPGSISGFAYGAFDSDPTVSATIGGTYSLENDYVLGASLGVARIDTLMAQGGSSSFNGPSISVFGGHQPDEGLNWLAGISGTALSGTGTRGYLNGSTPVTSTGTTSGSGIGFFARAGFTFTDVMVDLDVTPFARLDFSQIGYAGWTETTGPFPATFQAFSATTATFRIGADTRYEFSPDHFMTAGLAYGHTFSSGPAIAGSVPGVMNLNIPGSPPASDFIEASIGVEIPVTETVDAFASFTAVIPFAGAASIRAQAGATVAF